MTKKILFIITVAFCLMMIGCREASEEVIVIENGDAVEESIEANAEDEKKIIVPKTLEFDVTSEDNKINVVVDATIEMPDIGNLSIIELEPEEISDEKATKIINELIGDENFYMPRAEQTKEEIEKEIQNIQQSIDDPNSDFNEIYSKDSDKYKEVLRQKEEDIKFLQEAYNNAPETIVLKETSKIFETEDNGTYLAIDGVTESDMHIYMRKMKEKPSDLQTMQYYNGVEVSNYQQELPDFGVEISLDEAKNKAEEFVRNLEFENWDISLACRGYQNLWSAESILKEPQCYVFFFTRSIHLIKETYYNREIDYESLYNQNFPLVGIESITVAVTDDGVTYLEYNNPMKILDISKDAVEILEFDAVAEIAKQHLATGCDYQVNRWETEYDINRNIHIDRIVLGYNKILDKDSGNKYMLVPTWNFFGYQIDESDDNQLTGYGIQENGTRKWDSVGRSFLTINAMDGSIIDLSLGY